MSATDFIPLLLMVACVVSGVMAYVAKLALPGEDEYSSYHDEADILGRGRMDPSGTYGGVGQGYGYQEPASKRYYANGSHTNRGGAHTGRNAGYEEWARGWNRSYAPPAPPPEPVEPSWWLVLDVPRASDAGSIRKAYARAMQAVHPDIVGNDALTSERCVRIKSAYDRGRKEALANGRA